MNDLADDGFHEIQLSGKQLVALFMATTIVAVIIFLCGVQVGRNARSDKGTEAADPVAAAAPAPASAPSQPVASSGPPAAEPPAPAQEADDELSYAKRLQSESTPEKLKAQPDRAAARGAAPAAKAAVPTPPAVVTAPPKRPEPKAPAPSTGRPGTWIVQVISLQDRGAASAIARRLSGKGYPAFVLDPAPGAPAIYRVQVGGYTAKGEAEQASRRLEKDEQFKPLVRSR